MKVPAVFASSAGAGNRSQHIPDEQYEFSSCYLHCVKLHSHNALVTTRPKLGYWCRVDDVTAPGPVWCCCCWCHTHLYRYSTSSPRHTCWKKSYNYPRVGARFAPFPSYVNDDDDVSIRWWRHIDRNSYLQSCERGGYPILTHHSG